MFFDASQRAAWSTLGNYAVVELSVIKITLLLAAIGVVALLYSSVGHGGAAAYLVVAALLRWRTLTVRRALASVLWVATGKLLLAIK